MIISNLHHGWMSAESQAESYNETFRNHKSTKEVKKFLECNPGIGNHFNKKEDLDFPCSENYNETENRMTQNSMHELHRKSVRQAMYN